MSFQNWEIRSGSPGIISYFWIMLLKGIRKPGPENTGILRRIMLKKQIFFLVYHEGMFTFVDRYTPYFESSTCKVIMPMHSTFSKVVIFEFRKYA